MKRELRKAEVLFVVACVAVVSRGGQLGVGIGSAFGTQASFESDQVVLPFANDPGAAAAGIDHVYDDGYNLVDSSGNFGNETTFWGYQNEAQFDAATDTIRMSSTRTLIDAAEDSADRDCLGALELFWLQNFTSNKTFNCGFRLAARWQRVRVAGAAWSGTTAETYTDAYALNGISAPSAPFDGSYGGGIGNPVLGDGPTRSISTAAGSAVMISRTLDGHMLGFDFGPTLSWDLGERMALVASAGGTAMHIHSTFSYDSGGLVAGETTDQEWLFGAYAGADLQCRIGEGWGLFGGVAYTYLEDFNQQADGQRAELVFADSCVLRFGIYTEL
ncbi:hypothetical protein [Pontiella sp.]|uniref:hypothetical protein n=1 Tax=Pontiella sp. TaxID=2837462 RepID=UPI003569FF5E